MSSREQILRLVAHLQEAWPQTSKDLSSIGPSPLSLLHQSLFSLSLSQSAPSSSKDRTLIYCSLLSLANDKLNSFPFASVPECWRRLYTEAGLLWAIYDVLEAVGDRNEDVEFWEGVVARLDMVLIVAGAPGEGRRELIDDLIDLVQETHLPSPPWTPPTASHSPTSSSSSLDHEDGSSPPASKKLKLSPSSSSHPLLLAPSPIPSLPHPPSLTTYLKLHLAKPFILRSYLQQTGWPALDPSSPWKDRDYLLSVVGRGRIVPVEIGGEYTEEGWGQGMIKFEDFLERVGFGLSEEGKEARAKEGDARPPLYLAQHALLTHFPKLRRDVLLPDYVYSEPPESEVEGVYRRPPTEDGLLINVWVGGEGRSSPSHTDPYYNCYTQVVGSKRIFLTPPHHSSSMYPFSSSSSSSSSPPTSPSSPSPDSPPPPTATTSSSSATTTLMGNTSRVPIFNKTNSLPSRTEFPKFYAEALPESLEEVLDEGDMLVFPPGWWHALRQEGGAGWGVSFWY